LLLPMPL